MIYCMHMRSILFFLIVFPAFAAHAVVPAHEFAPMVLYAGKIKDGSFNQSAHQGVLRFEHESQLDVVEHSVSYQAYRFPVVLLDAINSGANPLITFPTTAAEVRTLEQFAAQYPRQTFVVIDQEVHLPNVQSILFKEQEATYLAGVLTGMASRSGTVGFVGGVSNQSIRERFAGGFRQGLSDVDPGISMLEEYIGKTARSWFKPERG